MAKEFWSKWEYRLWLGDRALGMCAPATRGVWVDAISSMMEGATDRLSGTPEQLSRVCRCSVSDFIAAIDDLSANNAADVHKHSGSITIINKKRRRELEISHLRQKAGAKGGAKTQQELKLLANSSNSNSDSVVPEGVEGEGEKPSLEAAKNYARKIGLPEIEAEKFIDHFTCTGWMVGKNKMKSWPHAMNNWKRNWVLWGSKCHVAPTVETKSIPVASPVDAVKRQAWQIQKDLELANEQLEKVLDPTRYGYTSPRAKARELSAGGDQKAKEDLQTSQRIESRIDLLERELRAL